MKILIQRGKAWFLIREKGKHYMVNTDSGDTTPIEDPQMVYKQGYCKDPQPTEAQVETIKLLIDQQDITIGASPELKD